MPFSREARRAYDAKRGSDDRKRNDARADRSARNETTFIGVDGEGVTRPDGIHEYVLLSMGDQSLYHADGSRLTTDEIFGWLWRNHEEGAAYVGFFLGYDFSQWFRDLPEDRARMLLTDAGKLARRRTSINPRPWPVRSGQWEFDILGSKRFKLRPAFSRAPWMEICDTGPMFQTSFLAAIDPGDWPEPICSDAEYRTIRQGKEERGNDVVPPGTPVSAEMIRYNVLENEVLARLMTRTNEGLVSMGVKLRRNQWFGPGQAAQAWLKNVAAEHSREAILGAAKGRGVEEAYRTGLTAAQGSYFGGWFEIMAHGPIPGTTWEYDINSAYPTIIAELPCLLHGDWIGGEGSPPEGRGPWVLVRATVRGSHRFVGAMLHRTPKGRVLRPQATSGWYWAHEVRAAQRAGLIDTVVYSEWREYVPCSCTPPFRAIRQLYEHRLTAGKKTPQGKALKLVYNSSYGKMAQSIGLPLFGNPVYASLITAGCRTMILDAIATHPERADAVVMVATDGVYFTTPHPTLDLDDQRLGAWSATAKENLTLFKPGVYWDDATRAAIKQGGRLKLKSRGVNAKALAKWVPSLDRQWKGFVMGPTPLSWPSSQMEVPFSIVTPNQALNRGKWHLCGAVEHTKRVGFSSWPAEKRMCVDVDEPAGFIRTLPYPKCPEKIGPLESTPYDKHFGMELAESSELAAVITPEGPIDLFLRGLIGA